MSWSVHSDAILWIGYLAEVGPKCERQADASPDSPNQATRLVRCEGAAELAMIEVFVETDSKRDWR